MIVNRKTYRLYDSYYVATDAHKHNNSFITIVKNVPEPRNEHVFGIRYISSEASFLQRSEVIPKEHYLQLGLKVEKIPVSALRRRCEKKMSTSDWIYDSNPINGRNVSFCYFKNKGRVQPLIPGKSKPSVLELFAGAGGMTLGFQNAGMETKWAVEKNQAAASTLKSHFGPKNLKVYDQDIDVFLENARKGNPAYPSEGEVDHIHASPPCQGFSRANRCGGQQATQNNELTFKFIEAIQHFKPATATYENVPGIFRMEDYVQTLVSELIKMNYQIRVEELNASDYGDPQNRKRVFIFAAAIKMCLPSAPIITHGPSLIPKRTVKDAIGGLNKEIFNPFTEGDIDINGICDSNFHCPHSDPKEEDHVLHQDTPSRTILGHSPVHYNGKRYLTVRETACLQSFPFDFAFSGSMTEQFKQVGNAVPVMVATQVARSVARVHGLP